MFVRVVCDKVDGLAVKQEASCYVSSEGPRYLWQV